MIKNLQKIGGIAALGHTAALVVGMVLSFTVMFPLLDAAPDQAQKFLADYQFLVYLWNWIVVGIIVHILCNMMNVVTGIAFMVRMK